MIEVLPDYHIHTPLCKHASGDMESYVNRAIEIGLVEIGFSDHMPVMPEPQFCMDYEDIATYVNSVRELQNRYEGRITILLGCEMDMAMDKQDEIRRIIDGYDFDYVIGSIHYLDGWPFDQKEYADVFTREPVDSIYGRFFDAIMEAANTGLYDITGHIDNIKRMGYRPEGSLVETYERIAPVLKAADCTVEINTSGIDTAANEPYPSPEFLRVLRSYDIPVTTGSDSHSPDTVGRHFDSALEYLSEAGYEQVAYFRGRKRIMHPLNTQSGENGASHG